MNNESELETRQCGLCTGTVLPANQSSKLSKRLVYQYSMEKESELKTQHCGLCTGTVWRTSHVFRRTPPTASPLVDVDGVAVSVDGGCRILHLHILVTQKLGLRH